MEVICTLSRSVFRIARLRRAPLALLVAAVALASGVVALAAVVAPSNSKGLVAVGPVDPVTRRCSHASGSPSHCPRPQSARPARSSTLMGRTRSSPSSPARGRSCSPRTSRPERRALTTPLQSRGGPFLKWDTGAPEGYLGDPNVEHAVTGSPFSTNFVRIEGKDIGAPGAANLCPDPSDGVPTNCIQSSLFTVQGRISLIMGDVGAPGRLNSTRRTRRISESSWRTPVHSPPRRSTA